MEVVRVQDVPEGQAADHQAYRKDRHQVRVHGSNNADSESGAQDGTFTTDEPREGAVGLGGGLHEYQQGGMGEDSDDSEASTVSDTYSEKFEAPFLSSE